MTPPDDDRWAFALGLVVTAVVLVAVGAWFVWLLEEARLPDGP